MPASAPRPPAPSARPVAAPVLVQAPVLAQAPVLVQAPVLAQALIVVDVTPMLPGGGNGGAKWFVLALLGELLRQRPDWRWLLLTTAANDGFLGEMFPAMERLLVIDGTGQLILRPDPGQLPGGRRADLLYCPFTAPFHARPAVPTVATVYDLQFAAYPQFFSYAEIQERSGHFSLAVQLTERLVCISDYVRDHVRRVTGIPANRLRAPLVYAIPLAPSM